MKQNKVLIEHDWLCTVGIFKVSYKMSLMHRLFSEFVHKFEMPSNSGILEKYEELWTEINKLQHDSIVSITKIWDNVIYPGSSSYLGLEEKMEDQAGSKWKGVRGKADILRSFKSQLKSKHTLTKNDLHSSENFLSDK